MEFIYNFFPSPKLASFGNTANRYQKYECVESANTSFMSTNTRISITWFYNTTCQTPCLSVSKPDRHPTRLPYRVHIAQRLQR